MEIKAGFNHFKEVIAKHSAVLKIKQSKEDGFTAEGTIQAMQGKQKVEGIYFCSFLIKPKDLRFYFFPIYTHKDAFQLSERMQKFLKGKSCFHLKELDKEILTEVEDLLKEGIKVYQKDQLLANA